MKLLKINNIIAPLLLGFALFFFSCKKKEVSVNFKEIECKDLKLSNANYSLSKDPCTNSSATAEITQTVVVHVDHNGKPDCLDYLKLDATFRRKDGSSISGVTYKNSYNSTDPEVTLTDSYLEIKFTYIMASQTDADALNAVEVEIYSQNELLDASNKLVLTIGLACSNNNVGGLPYTVIGDVTVTTSVVTIALRDYSQIDGDIVDVYLNGQKIGSNITLTDNDQMITATVNKGANDLVVIALNEGTSSPNTCEVRVNNGSGIKLTPGLKTGQAVQIKF